MAFKIISVSSVSTALTIFYLYASIKGIYNLMYPLQNIPNVDSFPPNQLVGNYWKLKNQLNKAGTSNTKMGMKVYLSTNEQFTADFIIDEFQQKQRKKNKDIHNNEIDSPMKIPPKRYPSLDTILLWEEPQISSPSLSKTFILTSSEEGQDDGVGNGDSESDYDSHSHSHSPSFQFAKEWIDELHKKEDAMQGGSGISAVLSSAAAGAGDGIESTSVLLSLYQTISDCVSKLFQLVQPAAEPSANTLLDTQDPALASDSDADAAAKKKNKKRHEIISIPKSSSIWKNLMNNSTVNVRVVITRIGVDGTNSESESNFQTTIDNFMKDANSHDLLVEGVDLVKYDIPHHIHKAKRYLYKDLLYILQTYVLQMIMGNNNDNGNDVPASVPWDMSISKPEESKLYETAMDMKERGMGYPYWKPEVAVKLVSEEAKYPLDYVGHSQMDVIEVGRDRDRQSGGAGKKPFESGYAYLPGLYVDEMGLTSEKYIPLNRTVDALPLRISFDCGELGDDLEGGQKGDADANANDGASSNELSPGRWRLLKHLAKTLEGQKELGFEQSDIDDVKRLVADTNITLLGITVMASVLHLLFEFLTFKNDVEFWRGNKDLTGLSVRALFMDFFSQMIILLYLIEKESSLLMTIPAACGCLIALWKAQRGSGLKFVKATKEKEENTFFLNKVLRVVGVELQATRLRAASKNSQGKDGKKSNGSIDLAALSEETDQLATRLLGKYLMLPLILGYTFHTLVNEEHSGWYSWFITSASSAMYGLGFVFMTPQLFMNYKLKSVAHLPWKVLGYRFVNTFIDDLFAFIIRMPTMARISCFRDDVVFIIYLWQRYLYPVDVLRPIEGGGMDAISVAAQTAVVEDNDTDIATQKKDQ